MASSSSGSRDRCRSSAAPEAFPVSLCSNARSVFHRIRFIFYWGIVRTLMKRGSHFLLSGSILATYGLALAMESGSAPGG